MDAATLQQKLNQLVPNSLAADWDNVGLLIEPPASYELKQALLCIDLNDAVWEEALAKQVDLIVAYHPPIFSGLKRFSRTRGGGRHLFRAIEAGIAVYSPHTALDATLGGVNDWLCSILGEGKKRILEPSYRHSPNEQFKLICFAPADSVDAIRRALSDTGYCGLIDNYSECSFESSGYGHFLGNDKSNPAIGHSGQRERVQELRFEMVCGPESALPEIVDALIKSHPYESPAFDIIKLNKKPIIGHGQGRELHLNVAKTIESLAQTLKDSLQLPYLRGAIAPRHQAGETIKSVALCPGAGGSLLSHSKADLVLTGEMRHHDVLALVENGTSVFLTEHTRCERGYLKHYAERLKEQFGDLKIWLSEVDQDPLQLI